MPIQSTFFNILQYNVQDVEVIQEVEKLNLVQYQNERNLIELTIST